MPIKIAPSILTADFGRLADEVRALEAAGADYLHLDVMDGHFVPPITFGALLVEALRKVVTLPFDIHLMIAEPERHVASFIDAGGDIINAHVEARLDFSPLAAEIRSHGRRAGVCINPETSLSAIEGVLAEVDQVMVMGVHPGWGGQPFIPETLSKVRRLRTMLDERGLSTDIEIDGGVKSSNIASCVQAGADVLVAGSAVFNSDAPVAENLAALRNAIAAG
jgi:ribulose-phosphate 3-epimerase